MKKQKILHIKKLYYWDTIELLWQIVAVFFVISYSKKLYHIIVYSIKN